VQRYNIILNLQAFWAIFYKIIATTLLLRTSEKPYLRAFEKGNRRHNQIYKGI
jgi:hypothetical protein